MAREIVVNCDVGGEAGASGFEIREGTTVWFIDLCEVHAKPLRRLLEKAQQEDVSEPQRVSSSRTKLDARWAGVPE